MVIACDIDGTLTLKDGGFNIQTSTWDQRELVYKSRKPRMKVIKYLQKRFTLGDTIIIYSSRGDQHYPSTATWLLKYKVPYHMILLNKPFYDIFIEDKSIHPKDIK